MASLSYAFSAQGADTVVKAFTGIARAAATTAAKVGQEAQKQQHAQERAAEKAADASRKSEERRWREVEKTGARIQRELEREAQARIRAEKKANDAIVADRQRLTGRMVGVGKFIGGAALTGAGLAIGTVGAAAREAMQLQGMAKRIAIAGHSPGEALFDSKKIAGALESTAIANPGTKSEDLAAGMKTMVEMTHDIPGAMAQLDTLAVSMQAMGTDAEGTAKTMVALRNSFGIKDTKEMQSAMAALNSQMKAAGVPLDAMESHVLALAATANRFGFHGAAGVSQMGGMIALATSGVGDPAKAEKAASKFMDKITEHSSTLGALGIRTQGANHQMLPMQQIVSNIISGLGGHNMGAMKSELVKLFGGGERGGAAVLGKAVSSYESTFNATKGTDAEKQHAATAALNSELERLMGSTASWGTMLQESASTQKGAGASLTVAWEEIKAKVAEDVLPALVSMVPAIRKLAESGIVDEFIGAVGAVVEGLSEMVGFLKDVGLIKPKEKSRTEQLQDANKKLERFEAGISNPMEMTPAQIAERKRLRGTVSDAQEALFPSAEAGATSNASKVFKTFSSPGDFAEQYARLHGRDIGAPEGSVQFGEVVKEGQSIANRIQSGETVSSGSGAVKELESQYASQIIQQKAAEAASKAETKAKQDATRAATEFAQAMRTARDETSRSQPLSARP